MDGDDNSDDAPIGIVDGKLITASEDYDDFLDDDEEVKTEDRRSRKVIIHRG